MPYSDSGMKVFSSAVSRPVLWRRTLRKKIKVVLMPKNLKNRVNQFGGRVTAISGSRPTMIVSLWWRAWLQRQRVDSRRTMKEAIS